MKKGIHPNYHNKIKATCSCGNTIETGSTNQAIEVEVCSACHPYYTGKHKLVDVAGRVDQFKQRVEKAKKRSTQNKPANKKQADKKSKKDENIQKIG